MASIYATNKPTKNIEKQYLNPYIELMFDDSHLFHTFKKVAIKTQELNL